MPADDFEPVPIGDDHRFVRAAASLLASVSGGTPNDDFAHHAAVLLEWKWRYSDGDLARWTRADLESFLLDWVPRTMMIDTERVDDFLAATVTFVERLAEAGILRGEHPTVLGACVERCGAGMRAGLTDPSRSPGKALMLAMREAGIDPRDREAVENWIEAFNARSFEARDAVLGAALDHREPAVILAARAAPDPASVADAASASSVLQSFERLRTFLGAGRPLTAKGNLKLADARAVVDLLETGDDVDPLIGGRVFRTRSAEHLPILTLILELAKLSRAVRTERGRMLAVKAWASKTPVEQLDRVADVVFEVGPVLLRRPWVTPAFDAAELLCDTAVNSLIAQMYDEGRALSFDDSVGAVADVVERFASLDHLPDDFGAVIAAHALEDAFDLLHRCGVVTWTDAVEETDDYGFVHRHGGEIALTPFGVHTSRRVLPALGFECPDVPPFDATASDDVAVIVAQLGAQLVAGGPALLCEAYDGLGRPELVGDLWRVDRADAGAVLDALGRHHLDKAVAKGARKAAMRHRSWYAGRSQ